MKQLKDNTNTENTHLDSDKDNEDKISEKNEETVNIADTGHTDAY